MSLTKAEAEQVVKEAIDQGWADEANRERATDIGEGSVDMWENHDGGGWDRSQAAPRHDWGPADETLNHPHSQGEVCRRCHTSRDARTEDRSCPGVWIRPQPTGTYHVELLFPGMYASTDKYWITSTDDWRKLKAKVDELKEIIKQAVERGWKSGSMAPRKAGKLGMYVEVVPPGGSRVSSARVGGMRTWKKLCREVDSIIDLPSQEPIIEQKQIGA